MPASRSLPSLRIASVLWVIWGAVHLFAGIFTLWLIGHGDDAEAIHGIVGAVELASLQLDYPPGVMAILSQHALNLAWFGALTLACAPWVWRGRLWAILLASLVGGLADLAYFLFIDLGGYATPPGPQMTIICAAAVALGLWGARATRTAEAP